MAAGKHTIIVDDVAGHRQTAEVVVPQYTASTDSEPPTPTAASGPVTDTLTEEGFKALITTEDVEAVLSSKVRLLTELFDYRQRAESVDPAQVVNIDSFYGLSYLVEGGTAGMTFSVMDFDSEASAQAQFRKVMSESPGMERAETAIGDLSAEVHVNAQGIGSVFVFVRRDKLVSLHTSQPEGEPPLISFEGLQQLAQMAERNLP